MEKIIKEPGIYPGVTYEEYAKWDCINNSRLWKLKSTSPMHVKHYIDNPPPSTDALRLGSAMHIQILEPQEFNKRFMVIPKWNMATKDGKAEFQSYAIDLATKKVITVAQCDAMVEAKKGKRDLLTQALALSGREVLDQAELDTVQSMHRRLKEQEAYQYITGRRDSDTELAIVWDDEVTGLRCKAKIDYANRDQCILCDLKSSAGGDFINISAAKFSRAAEQHGYHQQAAMYVDGWQALTGDICSFLFIAAEKEPPHCACSYEAHDDLLQCGRNSYRDALKLWQKCVKEDSWPGYNDGKIVYLQASLWLMEREGVGLHNLTE